MVRIPELNRRRAGQQRRPQLEATPSAAALGGASGQVLEQVGNLVQENAFKMQERANSAIVAQRVNEFDQFALGRLRLDDDNYSSRQGEDALGMYGAMNHDLMTKIESLSEGLTPAQVKMFATRTQPYLNRYRNEVSAIQLSRTNAYYKEVADQSLLNTQNAVRNGDVGYQEGLDLLRPAIEGTLTPGHAKSYMETAKLPLLKAHLDFQMGANPLKGIKLLSKYKSSFDPKVYKQYQDSMHSSLQSQIQTQIAEYPFDWKERDPNYKEKLSSLPLALRDKVSEFEQTKRKEHHQKTVLLSGARENKAASIWHTKISKQGYIVTPDNVKQMRADGVPTKLIRAYMDRSVKGSPVDPIQSEQNENVLTELLEDFSKDITKSVKKGNMVKDLNKFNAKFKDIRDRLDTMYVSSEITDRAYNTVSKFLSEHIIEPFADSVLDYSDKKFVSQKEVLQRAQFKKVIDLINVPLQESGFPSLFDNVSNLLSFVSDHFSGENVLPFKDQVGIKLSLMEHYMNSIEEPSGDIEQIIDKTKRDVVLDYFRTYSEPIIPNNVFDAVEGMVVNNAIFKAGKTSLDVIVNMIGGDRLIDFGESFSKKTTKALDKMFYASTMKDKIYIDTVSGERAIKTPNGWVVTKNGVPTGQVLKDEDFNGV